jgi:hypothetical protein
MKTPIAFALAGLVLFAAPSAAQMPKSETGPIPSLAELVPETVLAYVKLVDPVGDFERLMSDGDVWSEPGRTSAKTRRATDRGFKQADKGIGLDDGGFDGWMRSIGSIEFALFNFALEGGFGAPPTLDFAVIMESPLAIDIYNQTSKMMIDHGIAARNEQGNFVISGGDGFSATFAIWGSKVVLASDQSRLDDLLNSARAGGRSGSLASSGAYRAVCGSGEGPRVAYLRMASLLDVIRNALGENRSRRMDDFVRPLGFTNVAAIGYREDGPNGVVTMKGDGPVRLFQLLKGKSLPPTLQASLPADAAFTFGHTSDFGPQLRRIEAFLTDRKEFPYAPTVAGALTALTLKTGLGTSTILEPLKDGFVVALLPNEHGHTDPEEGLVVVAGLPAGEEAEKLFAKIRSTYEKSFRCEMEETAEEGVRWWREKPGSRKKADEEVAESAPAPENEPTAPEVVEEEVVEGEPVAEGEDSTDSNEVVVVRVGTGEGTDSAPVRVRRRRSRFSEARLEKESKPYAMAHDGKTLVVGQEAAIKRVLAAQKGTIATLASTGAFKRLPQGAPFYGTMNLKSIFSDSGQFGAALSALKGVGAIGWSMVAEEDSLTTVYNRAPGQMIGIMMGAGAMGDDARDEKAVVLDALREIGSRTGSYKEKNKKFPASLADLGYEAGKAPTFPDEKGKQRPIVFLPPMNAHEGWTMPLAYWDCPDFGRLVVSVDGYASMWSESRFQAALAKYNTAK